MSSLLIFLYPFHFNPRSREGSDRRNMPVLPVRRDFNPRSREGSDSTTRRRTTRTRRFQSTLPRGERRVIMIFVVM